MKESPSSDIIDSKSSTIHEILFEGSKKSKRFLEIVRMASERKSPVLMLTSLAACILALGLYADRDTDIIVLILLFLAFEVALLRRLYKNWHERRSRFSSEILHEEWEMIQW